MKKGDIVELNVDSIAFGGAGIGRYKIDDRAFTVFVDGTVPGDRIRTRITGKKRTYAFGIVEDFITKAPNRIVPRCKHFGAQGCGGCSLQNLCYSDQLKIKEQHVRDAMQRIGGLDDSIVKPIIGCESPWNYRNKMEFSFDRDLDSGKLGLGLHIKKRHHDTVELTECHLFLPYVGKFVTEVREFFRDIDDLGLLKDGPVLKSLVVREGKNTGEILVNLIAENGEARFLQKFVAMVQDFFVNADLGEQLLKSIYYTHIVNIKGQPKSNEELLLWGEPVINEILRIGPDNELKFQISPSAFFQPNTHQAEKLFELVIGAADLKGPEIVFDLYCGAGTIALACSKYAKKVYGIELNESAIKNARANSDLNGINNVIFEVGDVLKELPNISDRPDLIVVDPPRNGLHKDLIERISELNPGKVVYVSCNPASLARDLALFTKTGYTVLEVQPVDMFPQTYHIENVALLKR